MRNPISIKDANGRDVEAYLIADDGTVTIKLDGKFGLFAVDRAFTPTKTYYYVPATNLVIGLPVTEKRDDDA